MDLVVLVDLVVFWFYWNITDLVVLWFCGFGGLWFWWICGFGVFLRFR